MDVFTAINQRRSVQLLAEPGPTAAEIRTILAAALAAPDHGRRRPWRFLILAGAGKDAFADVVAALYRRRAGAEASADRVARERKKLARAPVVIVAVAVADTADGSIPRCERIAATSAATQNALLAATALGYGSMWRTGWQASDERVKEALGLAAADDIVAFVYLGTVPGNGSLPPRPTLQVDHYVRIWRHSVDQA